MRQPDKKVHAPIDAFCMEGGVLRIAKKSVNQWAEELGQTPFFLYEKSFLHKRAAELRHAIPKGVSIHYAMKANPFPPLVNEMAGLCDGIDVASAGELSVALNAGLKPHRISFAGPGKTDFELKQAAHAGCIVIIESENEAYRLSRIAESEGLFPNVALRINPDFELKNAGMRMSGGAKPFGVDAEKVPDLLSKFDELHVNFIGFHIFSGSQNLKTSSIIEAQNATIDLALSLCQYAPSPVKWLNIGGGFGVPYFPGDKNLNISHIGENLAEKLEAVHAELGRIEIILELGRYLVAEAGIYVTRIIDKKISRGTTYLITDGGLHHQLAASGNFGQVLRKNYPVSLSGNLTEKELVTITGCLCTPLDVLADRVLLPRANVGDFVIVYLSGAYGASASPSGFLGHGPAIEALV